VRVCVISECALSFRHGTGAQMIRLFDWNHRNVFHLYLTAVYGGVSEVGRSFRIEDPRWLGRGRRVAKRVERAVGLNWWNGDDIRPDVFRAHLGRNWLAADVAYVIAAHEEHALKMSSLLAVLGCPYVVHLMDIYHPDGLDPARMPGFRRLLAGASVRLAISDTIAAEMKKFGAWDVGVVPIGQEITESVAHPPNGAGPFRLLMVGKPYAEGLAVLRAAWNDLRRRFPDVEVCYSGQHVLEFPEEIRSTLRTSAYLSRPDYEALLARCHVAFLSGPLHLDRFGKFSIPSRIADYLTVGLPVLACVGEGTAMQRFLQPLVPDAVQFTRTPGELVASLESFRDAHRWRRANEVGRAFAVDQLDIRRIRTLIQDALATAAAGTTLHRA